MIEVIFENFFLHIFKCRKISSILLFTNCFLLIRRFKIKKCGEIFAYLWGMLKVDFFLFYIAMHTVGTSENP